MSSVLNVTFDREQLVNWLNNLGGDTANAFLRAVDDQLFENYFSDVRVLDITLARSHRRPILPHATLINITETTPQGATLAGIAPDAEFSTTVLPNVLEHLEWPHSVLRAVFAHLRIGGYMVFSLPHKHLYERKQNLPSRWDSTHRRFYTPASLLLELQAALGLNSFRLRFAKEYDNGFDYTSPHEQHARGAFSFIVVIEKLKYSTWYDDIETIYLDSRPRLHSIPDNTVAVVNANKLLHPEETADDIKTICIFKLDHIGDFAMTVPRFFDIREWFPNAKITCVCGPWNRTFAEMLGIFAEIVECNFFKADEKYVSNLDANRSIAVQELGQQLGQRTFDLAIDLRIPEDSRYILTAVKARYRIGIGKVSDFPFLDVALPPMEAFQVGTDRTPEVAKLFLRPGEFSTGSTAANHDEFTIVDSDPDRQHFIWGPYVKLSRGSYSIRPLIKIVDGDTAPARIKFDIAAETTSLLERELDISADFTHLTIEFEAHTNLSNVEFRFSQSNPHRTFLFYGIELRFTSGQMAQRKMVVAQLHMSEQQDLLLSLMKKRIFSGDRSSWRQELLARIARATTVKPDNSDHVGILIAPYSNSEVRDWPENYFEELIYLIASAELDKQLRIYLVGSNVQREKVECLFERLLIRGVERTKILPLAGQLAFSDLLGLIASIGLVVSNNSGIAHLAALLEKPIIALYSASHQLLEWGPVGRDVTIIQSNPPCSRCAVDRLAECTNGHLCMQMTKPHIVAAQIRAKLSRLFDGAKNSRSIKSLSLSAELET